MASRREFLQGAIAVSALPFITAAQPAASLSPRRTIPLYKGVYDERFAPARSFARQLRRSGVATAGFKGDITNLWFDDLDRRWRKDRSAVAIAGLTAPAALFCLERLAWDHGMRVVLEARHVATGDTPFKHEALRTAHILDEEMLRSSGTTWPRLIANAVTSVPSSAALPHGPTASGLPAGADDHSTALVSFVIAPIRRS